MKCRQFWSNQVRVNANIGKAGPGGYWELSRVIQSRIEKSAFAVHLQVGDKSIPMRHRTPARPGVQIYARQTEGRRNQSGCRLSITLKAFSIEKHFRVELSRAPA